MAERDEGGEHTGEIQEHSPWSLATSYFVQTGYDDDFDGTDTKPVIMTK